MKKYEQLKRLYRTMNEYMKPYDFSDQMVSALTADFDRLFQLAWKTLKEYMQNELMILDAKTGSPREIIKLAYHEQLIDDEEQWIHILRDRNDDTHHYKNSAAVLYTGRITEKYLNVIKRLIGNLSELIPPEKIADFRVPDSFVEAVKESGMSLDSFVEKIKTENHFMSEDDIFISWDTIKNKYLSK